MFRFGLVHLKVFNRINTFVMERIETLEEAVMAVLTEYDHDPPKCCGKAMNKNSDGLWHCPDCGKTIDPKTKKPNGGKGGDDGNGNVFP